MMRCDLDHSRDYPRISGIPNCGITNADPCALLRVYARFRKKCKPSERVLCGWFVHHFKSMRSRLRRDPVMAETTTCLHRKWTVFLGHRDH